MKADAPARTYKFLAVIRDGVGTVLTVRLGDINRTVQHETRIGSAIVGEFCEKHVAERAARQYVLGWRRFVEKKTGTVT